MKIILYGVPVFILIIVAVFFFILPKFADRRLNRVANRPFVVPSQNAVELYKKLWIADLHCDALLWQRDLTQKHNHGHVDIPRLIENNVALQVFTVVTSVPWGINFEQNEDKNNMVTTISIAQRCPMTTWTSLRKRALFQGRKLHEHEKKAGGRFMIIKSKSDLRNYNKRRKSEQEIAAGLLGIEGAQALDGEAGTIITFFEEGFRLLGLAHFCDNEIAGSEQGIQKGGLTEKGKAVIKLMDPLGMVIDLAHASQKTVDDVLDIATKPVMVSHTGVQGTCMSSRNLSDAQIERVAKKGGIVGITYFEEALGEMSIDAVVSAIKYVCDLVGVEHVALGSDWDGAIEAALDTTGLIDLTDALLKAGFSGSEIALVMGGNVQRVLLEILPE
ncbi:MAG: dipeptidase [bacterium]